MKRSSPARVINEPNRPAADEQVPALAKRKETFINATPTLDDDPEVFERKLRVQLQAFSEVADNLNQLMLERGSNTLHASVVARLPDGPCGRRYQVFILGSGGAGPGTSRIVLARPGVDLLPGETATIVNTNSGPLIVESEPDWVHHPEKAVVSRVVPGQDFPYCVSVRSDEYSAREMYVKQSQDLESDSAPEPGDEVMVENGFIFERLEPSGDGSNNEYHPNPALDRGMLVGDVPQKVYTHLMTVVAARVAEPARYLRSKVIDYGNYSLCVGETGTGKTVTLDCAMAGIDREFNRDRKRVVFKRFSAAGVHGRGIVGSAALLLNGLWEEAEKCDRNDQLLFVYIEELDKLIMPRNRLAHALDSGAGLEATSQFLVLTGSRRIKAVLVGDTNSTAENIDPAVRDRLVCFDFAPIDRFLLTEIFRRNYERDRDNFEGEWSEFEEKINQAYTVRIGGALAGSSPIFVTAGDITNGRMGEQTLLRAMNHANTYTYLSRGAKAHRITPLLLYNDLVRLAHSSFSRMAEDEARTRLAGLAGDKERSISRPRALPWASVPIPPEYNMNLESLGLIDEAQG